MAVRLQQEQNPLSELGSQTAYIEAVAVNSV